MTDHKTLEKPETCPTCNRYTTRGREQLAFEHRARPLSGIDLTKPLSELIAGIRSDLVAARGKLQDIGMGFTGWRERVEMVEGLLTCGLMALHHTMEEMREHERKYCTPEIEAAAKLIYEQLPYDGPAGTAKPAWVPFGNSMKQAEARQMARASTVGANVNQPVSGRNET